MNTVEFAVEDVPPSDPSPNNPMADANGNIFVTPGNKLPAIPAHQ